ncbi:MAG: class I SAM-dependent methyltransferase [Myxococcales bacterium]|nr:class I SAM-dependent methyltransferase [Myxococcales bacterium]MDH3482601.1 class I SAM-dependent methyltransferase [Myxococcales bacterium]
MIEELCRVVGIPAPAGWPDYFETVKAWGARTDLTGARTDAELAEILFLDAARLIEAAWLQSVGSLVDIGAGVGAPTIPLLLASPGHRATLVEPRRKRTAFLRSAIGSLDLADRALVLEQSVDPDAPLVTGAPFDVALSRATFSAGRWREIGSRLADEVWVFTAGTDPVESDLRLLRRIDYEVPSTGAPRSTLAYSR